MASKMDEQRVSAFCDPIKEEFDKPCDPRITAFKVDEVVMRVLPKAKKYQQNYVFRIMWRDCCKSLHQQCITIVDAVEHVWIPVEKRLVVKYHLQNRLLLLELNTFFFGKFPNF